MKIKKKSILPHLVGLDVRAGWKDARATILETWWPEQWDPMAQLIFENGEIKAKELSSCELVEERVEIFKERVLGPYFRKKVPKKEIPAKISVKTSKQVSREELIDLE